MDMTILLSALMGSISWQITGRSYVVFGGMIVGNKDPLVPANLNGSNGFSTRWRTTWDYSGSSVIRLVTSMVMDIRTILIGAPCGHYSPGSTESRPYLFSVWRPYVGR